MKTRFALFCSVLAIALAGCGPSAEEIAAEKAREEAKDIPADALIQAAMEAQAKPYFVSLSQANLGGTDMYQVDSYERVNSVRSVVDGVPHYEVQFIAHGVTKKENTAGAALNGMPPTPIGTKKDFKGTVRLRKMDKGWGS